MLTFRNVATFTKTQENNFPVPLDKKTLKSCLNRVTLSCIYHI